MNNYREANDDIFNDCLDFRKKTLFYSKDFK